MRARVHADDPREIAARDHRVDFDASPATVDFAIVHEVTEPISVDPVARCEALFATARRTALELQALGDDATKGQR
jgi:hypothetical protein